jgi:hypothetical protein
MIDSLRKLADFLDANPAVPLPLVTAHHYATRAPDQDMRAEIDQIAAALDVEVDAMHDHYAAWRYIGAIRYEAVAILSAARTRFEAETSYTNSIVIDASPVNTAESANTPEGA